MSWIIDEFAQLSQRRLNQVRLQFLADGDWKAQLVDSELPSEVQAVIRDTIEQTKLWRFEKAEVASEMIAHFQDGHRRGKTYEELQETFGDPLVTSQLVRNSKIRNRPMVMKSFKMIFFGGAGFSALYLAMLAFFYSASPDPSTDYVAMFNSPVLSTPEDQRAWPIYRDAWTKHEFCEGANGRFEEIYLPGQSCPRKLVRPEDEQWKAAVEKLSNSQDLLDSFRRGYKLPYLGVAIYSDSSKYSEENFAAMFPGQDRAEMLAQSDDNCVGLRGLSPEGNRLIADSGIGILLPHIQAFRKAAHILIVDARLAIQENDSDRVVENIEIILGLSRQASETPCLVCNLVGVAVAKIGMDLAQEVVQEHLDFLSDEQLEQLQVTFEEIDFTEYVDFEGERALAKDLIQRIYSDDGNGDGRVTPVGMEVAAFANEMTGADANDFSLWPLTFAGKNLAGPALMATAVSRKQITAKLDSVVDEVNRRFDVPFWLDDLSNIEEDIATFMEENTVVIPMSFLNYGGVKVAIERTVCQRDAVVLALAIKRFEREFERMPNALEELSDGFLNSTPLDRMNGEPLNFRYDDDRQLVIYSVGLDLDDDQGRPTVPNICPMSPSLEFVEKDGDWVLWPTLEDVD